MAKDNRTYYNPRGNRFTGMFDSGEAFVPVDWSKITGDIVDRLQEYEKVENLLKHKMKKLRKKHGYVSSSMLTKKEKEQLKKGNK